MIVRSKAPYRVSFGDGGTDMEPFSRLKSQNLFIFFGFLAGIDSC
ncbi:MAG: hypothetical protein ACOC44_13610 [Promethearchaeia archaeon]